MKRLLYTENTDDFAKLTFADVWSIETKSKFGDCDIEKYYAYPAAHGTCKWRSLAGVVLQQSMRGLEWNGGNWQVSNPHFVSTQVFLDKVQLPGYHGQD